MAAELPKPEAVSVIPIRGLPMVSAGDDLAQLLISALKRSGGLEANDVLVIAQKIISKAEGRQVDLGSVRSDEHGRSLSAQTGKTAELAQLILSEGSVMRAVPGTVITRHRTGHVMANAGIDASNVSAESEHVLLWPTDPDTSARQVREALEAAFKVPVAVVISDSLGRAWRIGTTGTCIGASGIDPLRDRRGESDLFGRTLQATVVAVADEIASAASLIMGEGAEAIPAAIVRGAVYVRSDHYGAGRLVRPQSEDLFP